jgi:hypothetical protein
MKLQYNATYDTILCMNRDANSPLPDDITVLQKMLQDMIAQVELQSIQIQSQSRDLELKSKTVIRFLL